MKPRQHVRSVMAAVLVTVVAVAAVLGATTGTAAACSCTSVHPIDLASQVDTVFVGTATKTADGTVPKYWNFQVDAVIKGEVTEDQLVLAENFSSACGTNFNLYDEPVVIYASGAADDLREVSCAPTLSAQEFNRLIADIADPSGAGPPAALMAGVANFSDFAVLDNEGRTLARTSLGIGNGLVAHCANTSRAAVVALTEPVLKLVDLNSLVVLGEYDFVHGPLTGPGDRIACFDGGNTVVAVSGAGSNQAEITAITGIDLGFVKTQSKSLRASRALPTRAGTIIVLSHRSGDPLQVLVADTLQPILGVSFDIPAEATLIDGAVSADGSQLAALATLDGRNVTASTGATHVLVFDLVRGRVKAGEPTVVALPEPGDDIDAPQGAARRIAWIGSTGWLIESDTVAGQRATIIRTSGNPFLDAVDLNPGGAMVPIPTGLLRTSRGGLEVLAIDGRITPGDPAPSEQGRSRDLALAPLMDAPELAPSAPDVTITFTPPLASPSTEVALPRQDATADQGVSWVVPALGLAAVAAAAGLWLSRRRLLHR